MTWWRDGVLYQLYPRSFADSDGDGTGDLRGVIDRLDHLAWLGVSGIWLNPTFPSPNDDWGYDVSDYRGVHPDLGTPEDLDALIAAAGERGIRVLLDLVPNHTSIAHPWWTEHPDYYTWAQRPNNWESIFGGSAWKRVGDRYYLHLFLETQPDLNWWNPAVADEFDAILRFWLDRGVAGFRIDVCQAIVKDRLLRDDPGHSAEQPEVHDVIRRWRRVVGDALLVGETYVFDLDTLAAYYGDGSDELDLGFNIPFIRAPLTELAPIVAATDARLPGWPVWAGSNHDAGRLATRWAAGDEDRTRLALLMLLTLRGTPFLYMGDEIGLTDGPVTDLRDKADGRDGCRTPMPWGDGTWGDDAWLPLHAPTTVAEQRDDPDSILHLVRELIAVRREFVHEPYEAVSDGPVWIYRRGPFSVALNLSDAACEMPPGEVVLSTRPLDTELGPWQGVLLRTLPS